MSGRFRGGRRDHLAGYLFILPQVAGAVVFWTLFEQAGSSLNQFAERNTQLAIGAGQSMSAAQTQMSR